jgi:hypothetical protein
VSDISSFFISVAARFVFSGPLKKFGQLAVANNNMQIAMSCILY